MPVSPHGFEAWIEVEGTRLKEFKVESQDDRMVCWVPCEAGKEFKIGCTVPSYRLQATNHIMFVELDGTHINPMSNIVRQDLFAACPANRLFSEELVKGAQATRAFQFGGLELTDDDSLCNSPAKQFGEINVVFNSVQAYVPIGTWSGSAWKDDYRAHERSKKGISHCVKLGEEKPRTRAVNQLKAIGIQKVCSIVFKYRQMDVLVADGIAPRKSHNPVSDIAPTSGSPPAPHSAQPSPLKRRLADVKEEGQVARDLIDPTDEDIERAEKQLAAMKAKRAQGGQPPAKRVKKEPKHAFVPGEVIDLTNLPSSSHVKQEPKASFHGEVIDLT